MGLHEYTYNDRGFVGSIQATSHTATFRCQSCREIHDLKDAEGELCYYCARFFESMTNDSPIYDEHTDSYFPNADVSTIPEFLP